MGTVTAKLRQNSSALNQTTAHTPGPWSSDDGRPNSEPSVFSEKHCLATVWINDLTRKEAEANARLMAVAPDLLEALKIARDCIAYCRRAHKDAQSGEGFPVEFLIDAALAKAEGRS